MTATVVVVGTVSLSTVNAAYVAKLQLAAVQAAEPGAWLLFPAASVNFPAATVMDTANPLVVVEAQVHV